MDYKNALTYVRVGNMGFSPSREENVKCIPRETYAIMINCHFLLNGEEARYGVAKVVMTPGDWEYEPEFRSYHDAVFDERIDWINLREIVRRAFEAIKKWKFPSHYYDE
jgi:hypothetical protein